LNKKFSVARKFSDLKPLANKKEVLSLNTLYNSKINSLPLFKTKTILKTTN